MKILDIANITPNLLTEANILNVKDPHDGHSIQKYLKHYAKSIGSDMGKKMFIKKLQKLLLNDEKYHFAVRELPADAPDWAQQAMVDRDLFYFKADTGLNNAVEHLTHYIAKMEEDMEGADANKKAVATKEFAGFAKAESLEMLEKKSNEYFERGGSKDASFEGTKVLFKSGGFTWMKLETADAFRNAGSTLNNCIGSHYTKAGCDSSGESIIVLADAKGDLIVAARIANKANELQEMKGKNNRPPIKQYMSPVAAMINKFKLGLSSGAHHDVIAAGYYFDAESKTLLTKPQALKKLVAFDVIGTIAHGLKLVQPKPTQKNEAAWRLFSELYRGNAYTWNDGMGSDEVYEGRLDNGNPVMIAIIENGKLSRLNTFFNDRLHDESHLQEAIDMSKKKDYVKAFVTELIQRGHIRDIKKDILRHIFWELKLEWDAENKRLVDRAGGEEKHLDKKDHKWNKFVDRSTVDAISKTFGSDIEEIAHPIKKIFVATEEVADDRSRNEHDIHLVVVVDSDDVAHLANMSGKGMSQDHVGFKKEIQHSSWSSNFSRVSVDHKTMRSVLALAKDEHFTLKTAAKARFGVNGDDPEHYSKFEPKWEKLGGDPESIKVDFSHLRDEDRFNAIYSTAMTELGGVKSKDSFGLNDKLKGEGYNHNAHNINTAGQFKNHDSKSANKAIGDIDSIYKVDVGYGTAGGRHGVMLMVSKKKIVKVDSETENHNWQGWDDFDKVADALNAFADKHKMAFTNSSVTEDKRSRKEFRAVDGKLTTMSKVKTAELSRKKKKEGTDDLQFGDGWSLHRMTPDEQAKWIRRGMKEGVRGQAWLLKDDDDNKHVVFTILHQRIARMFYHHGGGLSKEWPTSYGKKVGKYLPYLKTAMKEFGWRAATTGTMKDENVSHSTIQHLQGLADQRNPDKPGPMAGSLWEYQNLERDGFVEKLSPRRFKITELGKSALDEYKRIKKEDPQKSVSKMDMLKGHDTHGDWKNPKDEPPAAAPAPAAGGAARTPRAPRAAGVGTKATQALDKFRAHVDEHGSIPTRGEFIAYMEEDPFNMGKAGAQTYYYSTKKKYANLNESVLGSLAQLLLVEPDALYSSFADMVID